LTRRILTIIVAIVLAVIGTGAVLIYVKQADQRALAGQKAVSVLVATQQVPAGTTAAAALHDGYLQAQKLPAASVPADAVRSIGPAISGLVLSADLPSGQLLLRPMLVTAVEAATGLPIPAGKVALTVQMCLQKAVAGYIRPGSLIAVFNTFFKGNAGSAIVSCAGDSWQNGATDIHTRLVLNDVAVLAVGQASAGTGTTGVTTTTTTSGGIFTQGNNSSSSSDSTVLLVTVAVSQADAERLIHLAEDGIPYMALVGASSGTKPDVSFKP
jgi:pilus assembly protein CpaB